jgi:phosphoenolpyruvate carboxykinase (GTP)
MSSTLTQKTIEHRDVSVPLSTNKHLLNWVEKMALLTKPDSIHWVDGSVEEDETLKAQMVRSGTFTKLNEELLPALTEVMLRGSKIARLSARFRGTAPAQPTIGKSPTRCVEN